MCYRAFASTVNRQIAKGRKNKGDRERRGGERRGE